MSKPERPTYVSYFTSQDIADDGVVQSTWSVWREEYASATDDDPIDGSGEWISSHPTEAEADAEANRLWAPPDDLHNPDALERWLDS